MNALKNTVYYVVIVSSEEYVQKSVRGALAAMLPQVIVESLIGDEVVRFVLNPHLIPDMFLVDKNQKTSEGFDIIQFIQSKLELQQIPLVLMSDEILELAPQRFGDVRQTFLQKQNNYKNNEAMKSSLNEIWNQSVSGKSLEGLLRK